MVIFRIVHKEMRHRLYIKSCFFFMLARMSPSFRSPPTQRAVLTLLIVSWVNNNNNNNNIIIINNIINPMSTSQAEDWEIQRDQLKKEGDAAFGLGQWGSAVRSYSEALSLDPQHAVLLSNRSAAYLKNGQKSAALHDAQACVQLGTLGLKGQSRLAAALQALGRWRPALRTWEAILEQDPRYAAALHGVETCRAALSLSPSVVEEEKADEQQQDDDDDDDLADFFQDVEEAAQTVVEQRQQEATTTSHEIMKHKTNLGTVQDQIARLLADNYQWRNLNPFYVLDLPHTATADALQRRYKALSLLLHPDKNVHDQARAQQAYDEVLKAKAVLLDDPDKANHVRQLVEQGLQQGQEEFNRQTMGGGGGCSLEECQSKAVQRIFAEIEYKRRQVLERQRQQEMRERQQEEEGLRKEKEAAKFDQAWREGERVDKRVGNWRGFQKKKKAKI